MKKITAVWSRWKKISEVIGDFQVQVIFSLLHLFLVIPIGLLFSFLSKDFKLNKFTEWKSMTDNPKTLTEMREQ